MESFGARLKQEREKRKVSLDDIARATKIGTRFLSALEEERFDILPGGMFNKSFVRAYARHLGIDEGQAVADYEKASGENLPERKIPEIAELEVLAAQAKRKKRGSGPGGGIRWGAFAVVLLIIAFLSAIWGFISREKTARPARTPRPAAVTVPAAAAAANTATPKATPAAPETSSPGSAAQASPASGSMPVTAAGGVAEAANSSLPASTAAASIPPGEQFLVQLKAREDSWVAISADGKPVLQETLAAPAEKSIAARDRVVIKTGNAGALDFSFNGKPLPPQGGRAEVKTLTFDSNGLRSEPAAR